ncbi:MAG TPA: ABC transporter permease [Chthoniobacterales bacterium]
MKENISQIIKRLGPIFGLLAVVILFSALRPATFATLDNLQIILLQTAVVGTAALGMTFVIISGGIDLSVGSVVALSTVTTATLLARGWPPPAAALGAIAAGLLVGLFIGTMVTKAGLTPFITTLGLWGAVRGLAKGLANEQTVIAPDTWLNGLLTSLPDDRKWMLFPPGIWILLVLAIIMASVLRYAIWGRHVFAVGSNELTARLCGISIVRTKLGIYLLGSGMAATAGVLQFSYLTVGDPTTGTGMELDVIAAVVIGGASLAGGEGSILGSLIGALIMTCVANGCTKMEFPNWAQEIVTGGIIITAVLIDRFRRKGIS